MKRLTPLIPSLLGWGLLLSIPSLFQISLVNGLLQVTLFLFVVCIPAWKTGRMSYVDIGWPWGLALIGLMTLIFAEGHWLRNLLVSAVYLFMGLRMGLGAVQMWRLGILDQELPRYQYQHRRWEKRAETNVPFAMQIEVILQGAANVSFLAMPAFIIGSNSSESISIFEVLGLLIWIGAFVVESLADTQKLNFLKDMRNKGERNKVCNVGLWRYSRHPNYFAEWMVWNALIVATIPSLLALVSIESTLIGVLFAISLLFISRFMYYTLVYHTGAIPAEFYSVQKRPEYKSYQASTNIFFPGKPR